MMGFVSKRATLPTGRKLKVHSKEAIVVTRNGVYAGTMVYVSNKTIAINDHAYVLELKDEWKGSVNLRWFINQYGTAIRATVSSKNDNATFNKNWLSKVEVTIPEKSEQDSIVERVTNVKSLLDRLDQVKSTLITISQGG